MYCQPTVGFASHWYGPTLQCQSRVSNKHFASLSLTVLSHFHCFYHRRRYLVTFNEVLWALVSDVIYGICVSGELEKCHIHLPDILACQKESARRFPLRNFLSWFKYSGICDISIAFKYRQAWRFHLQFHRIRIGATQGQCECKPAGNGGRK